MTKEELRAHCEKQIKMCEEWAKGNDREPSGKIYEEHKLILDLINELQDKSYELWKESYEEELLRNIRLEKKIKALEQQSSDCVSRADARHLIAESFRKNLLMITFNKMFKTLYKGIDELPPVTPTHGTCKDCANYVMGALDEEICLRGHELIHKDFYCADFEKRGNEND